VGDGVILRATRSVCIKHEPLVLTVTQRRASIDPLHFRLVANFTVDVRTNLTNMRPDSGTLYELSCVGHIEEIEVHIDGCRSIQPRAVPFSARHQPHALMTNEQLHSASYTLLLLLHPFNGPLSRVSQHQKGKTRKVKPIWIYWTKK